MLFEIEVYSYLQAFKSGIYLNRFLFKIFYMHAKKHQTCSCCLSSALETLSLHCCSRKSGRLGEVSLSFTEISEGTL